MERIAMSHEERDHLGWLKRVKSGDNTQREAPISFEPVELDFQLSDLAIQLILCRILSGPGTRTWTSE
jgi:hypothetical protein